MDRKPIGLHDHARNTNATATAALNPNSELSMLGEVSALRETLALLRQQARETSDPATLLRLAAAIARLTDAIGRALNTHNKLAPSDAPLPARLAPPQATQPAEVRPRPALLATSSPSSLAALLDEVDRLVPPIPAESDDGQAEPPVPPGTPVPMAARPHRPAQPKRPSRSQRSRRGRR